jgi:hypothetical protein
MKKVSVSAFFWQTIKLVRIFRLLKLFGYIRVRNLSSKQVGCFVLYRHNGKTMEEK